MLYHLDMNIVPVNILNSIPFWGIIVVFFSIVYWVLSFFIIYHLTRFGIGARPKLIALIFFIGSIVLFSIFIISASRLDLNTLFQQAGDYIKSLL